MVLVVLFASLAWSPAITAHIPPFRRIVRLSLRPSSVILVVKVMAKKKNSKGKGPEKAQSKTDAPAEPKKEFKPVADNRKARHEYEILESYEAGIELVGTEVKSLRKGLANLKDAFAKIEKGQVWLYNCHVSPYDHGNRFNHEPLRKRRLLLNRREILKLKQKTQEKGLTLIPLKLYFKGNWCKVSIGLCKGKRLYDKRDSMMKRENTRNLERLMKRGG